jgi:endonuclease/exonuclease/phosphatase family metal-dependent hydrolase
MMQMLRLLPLLLIIPGCTVFHPPVHQALRLLSYNIRNAKGMDNQTNYDRVSKVISTANADIVGLQELDSATKRSNGMDVLKTIADKTGLHPTYGAAISFQGGKYGVGILSKQKPRSYYTIPLPGKEEERVLLVAAFQDYVIFCTHLSLTEADRISSAAIINREAIKYQQPVYLLGDLNAEPGSAALSLLNQKWNLLSGEALTFPAPQPEKCIDFIYALNSKKKLSLKTVIAEPMASDHRPVMVDLR